MVNQLQDPELQLNKSNVSDTEAPFLVPRRTSYGVNISQLIWFARVCNHLMDFNHYANTPMLYTAIFHGYKNDYFQMKCFDIFLIFAQNIDRGYTLELPH